MTLLRRLCTAPCRIWLASAIVLVACSSAWISSHDSTDVIADEGLRTVAVVRGPMTRTVTARGQLDAWRSTRLISKCYWDTTILKLVPEGTLVRKGDIICELDASRPTEYAKTRRIRLIGIKAELTNAQIQEKMVQLGNRRRTRAAGRRLADAKNALAEFTHGTDPLTRSKLAMQTKLAEARMAQVEFDRDGCELMYRKGISTKWELDSRELDLLAAEQDWTTNYSQAQLHDQYQSDRDLFQLQGELAEAEATHDATALRNELSLTQAEFARLSDERRFAHYTRYLGYALDSIEACTIRAPHAGRVLYAGDWQRRSYRRGSIEEGAEVDYRQAIIDLPDYARFVVKVWAHETAMRDLAVGQPTTVTVPALDNLQLAGRVSKVSRFSTVRNRYQPGNRELEVEIDFEEDEEMLADLAPRMDAAAEIVVEDAEDVLQVPVECIVHGDDGQSQVIVSDGLELRVRNVQLGRTDESHIEVLDGLVVGEQLIVDPPFELQDRLSREAAAKPSAL